MLVRLGYVAMSLHLENCSPSKTITVKSFGQIAEAEAKLNRLRRIARENLQNCARLLYYNAAHRIHVFRFTSKLVPLATHPLVNSWDYTTDLADDFARVGEIVQKHHMRVSSHPDHYTLINSPKPEVLESSLRDLGYHEKVFAAMGLLDAEMIMHVGGLYGCRELSLNRFRENFRKLPAGLKQRLRLENDDKCFGARDVLALCRELNIPMVLDVHHHVCHNAGEELADVLGEAFSTWGDRLPKVHFSSPRSASNCRAHSDDIDIEAFHRFLMTARIHGRDFDVMIEAKNKDEALFKLMAGLNKHQGIRVIEEAAIEV